MIKLIKSTFYKEAETRKKLQEFISRPVTLSMSEECQRFENGFAQKQGRAFCVFVNSGSSANLVLLQALLNTGCLKRGDRVGFSAVTWATNVMPIIQLGLVPVPVDCELETLNVSGRTLTSVIEELKAFFITNALGFSDDIKAVRDLCNEHKVLFLEDNCESLGSQASGTLLGNFGLASTFSFFVGHHLSTIEGGMVCTDDADLHRALIMTRAHGWDRDLTSDRQQELRRRHAVDDFFALYTFYELGFNVRPTEIQGFLGNVQLTYWDEIVSKRESNFKRFQEVAQSNSDVLPPEVLHMDVVSNFAMPLVFRDDNAFIHYREKFVEAGVQIRPIIAGNIVEQPFYKKHVSDQRNQVCKNAQTVHRQGFYFPNNPELTEEEITTLCSLIRR